MRINPTVRVLLLYVVFMIAGQAIAVGIGLALDAYSKTVALAVFIPLYYAMYWVAWRAALFVGEPKPAAETEPADREGGPGVKAASWLLAPAVLALEFAD